MADLLAWGLLRFIGRDIRKYMGKRFVTYTLALFVLVSSVAFACPDIYNLSSLSHSSSLKGRVMDRNPCRDMDNKAPRSVCYQVLHARLLYSLPAFSFRNVYSAGNVSAETLSTSDILLVSADLAASFESYSKPTVILLYHVLRI